MIELSAVQHLLDRRTDASVIRRREAHCRRRSTQPVQMSLDGERTGVGDLERLEDAITDHETMVGGGYGGGALTFVAHPVDPHAQVLGRRRCGGVLNLHRATLIVAC